MLADRKRRIDQLVGHLENKLGAKRRKLESLQTEQRWLEYDPTAPVQLETSFQAGSEICSTPIAKRAGFFSPKSSQSPQPNFNESSLSSKFIKSQILKNYIGYRVPIFERLNGRGHLFINSPMCQTLKKNYFIQHLTPGIAKYSSHLFTHLNLLLSYSKIH